MPLSPGSQIAGYRVVSLLGSGGMGEVYLVENPQLLRREALKVISLAGSQDPDFQRRFTNEARTTAKLDHPSIISIHQYGITDGTPWFTMNYLEGKDLTSGPITPSEVVEVTGRVADALDYAHRHQVIHRDIKPANIIVTRDPATGEIERVTVLDFGIAKLVNSTSLTATSAFIGTLAYCAPEVIEGHDAGPAADQYSLACTVYQLLCGQAPFPTTTPSALVLAHLSKPIPPLRAVRPELTACEPVLVKALAKNPADRYPDCRGFAAALRQAQQGGAVAAPTVGPTPLTPPPVVPAPVVPPGFAPPGFANPPAHAGLPGSPSQPGFPNPPSHPGFPNPPSQPGFPNPPSQPGAVGPTAQFTGPQQPPPFGSAPNNLVGGPFPSGPPQPPKKRTGLIIGSVAAAVVIIVVAALGISWAAGLFGSDEETPTTPASNALSGVFQGAACSVVEGSLYCAGENGAGQLGNGSTSSSTSLQRVDLTEVTAVTLGGYGDEGSNRTTTCAVAGGQAYCWGSNYYGQVGNRATGSDADQTTPFAVSIPAGTVTAIATGYGSTCAVATGDVYCWGDNDRGQLGLPDVDDTTTPTKVTGISGATAITMAQGSTCAVADGGVYCWGDNAYGQLGNGNTDRTVSPAQVPGVAGATTVSLGVATTGTGTSESHTVTACASTEDGNAFCWGANNTGQLGDGTTAQSTTPKQVSGLSEVRAISTGGGATCAIGGDTVYCWGDNTTGQLGTGGAASVVPIEVGGLDGDPIGIGTGGSTCAVTGSGLYCWGGNDEGQLGNGSSSTVSTPTQISVPS
ncbi:MAG: protein kinase [Gordonia sp. (in: high G+C Gram-positive bacteria)]